MRSDASPCSVDSCVGVSSERLADVRGLTTPYIRYWVGGGVGHE